MASTTASGLGTMPPVRPWRGHGDRPLERQPHVLDDLARPTSRREHRARAAARAAQRVTGNGHSVTGPEQAGPDARRAGPLDRRPRDAGGGPVGDDDDLGVLEQLAGPAGLALPRSRVLRLERVVVRLEVLGLEVERADDPRLAAVGALDGPVRGLAAAAAGTPARPAPSPGPGCRRRGSSPASGSAPRARTRPPRARSPRRSTTARAPARGSRRGRGPSSPGGSRPAPRRWSRGPGRRA